MAISTELNVQNFMHQLFLQSLTWLQICPGLIHKYVSWNHHTLQSSINWCKCMGISLSRALFSWTWNIFFYIIHFEWDKPHHSVSNPGIEKGAISYQKTFLCRLRQPQTTLFIFYLQKVKENLLWSHIYEFMFTCKDWEDKTFQAWHEESPFLK